MKRTLRKTLVLLFAIVLVASMLAGCGGTNTNGGNTNNGGAAQEQNKAYRVGIVTDQGIDQSEWLQNMARDLRDYDTKNDNVEINLVEATEVQEFEPKLRSLAESGYDLIISMYTDMAEQTIAVAKDFPNIKFGSMDGAIPGLADKANIQEFGLNRLETAFIAGVVGAATSESGKVGMVAGADEPVINMIVAGWQQGLRYVNPDIEDLVVYANTFTDPTIGKEFGLSLVSKECDVIAAAAGGTGVGTAQAAAETGTSFVAWDTHYPEVFGTKQLELGSAVNDFGAMTLHFIEETLAGNYSPGKRIEYGMSTGACSFEFPEGSPVSNAARELADKVAAEIGDGKISISPEPLHK